MCEHCGGFEPLCRTFVYIASNSATTTLCSLLVGRERGSKPLLVRLILLFNVVVSYTITVVALLTSATPSLYLLFSTLYPQNELEANINVPALAEGRTLKLYVKVLGLVSVQPFKDYYTTFRNIIIHSLLLTRSDHPTKKHQIWNLKQP